MILLVAKGRSGRLHVEGKDRYANIRIMMKIGGITTNGSSGTKVAHSGRNSSCHIPFHQLYAKQDSTNIIL
jgi:hypothetical protein